MSKAAQWGFSKFLAEFDRSFKQRCTNMNNLSEFKLRYINNPYSNKDTFFIFDELSILLKSLTSDELKKIGLAKNLADRQLDKQRKKYKSYVSAAYRLVEDNKEPYSKFFYPDGINKFYTPKYDEISSFFNTQQINENLNSLLENYLEENVSCNRKIKIAFLGTKRASEIMGMMALYWLKKSYRVIGEGYLKGKHKNDFDGWLHHNKKQSDKFCFLACEAIIKAQKFKFLEKQILISETGKELIEASEKIALRKRGKEGVQARHKATNDIKNKILAEYDQMYLEALSKNKKPISKDRFAEISEQKYNGQVKTRTIRRWLQGYNPIISK